MKKKDNLIHIKLDYNEAVQSKKDVLNTEVDLIKIAQGIKKYRALRLRELQLKIELLKKLKNANSNLRKTKRLLPKVEIPKILKKHEEEMHHKEEIKELEPKKERTKKSKGKKSAKAKKKKQEKKKPEHFDNLEVELRHIQEKLSKLE